MSLYLPVRTKGSAAIAICPRCSKKMYLSDMVLDPNNLNWYCKEDADTLDPWRLPARLAEDISLDHPRPDVKVDDAESTILSNESGVDLDFPPELSV